MKYNIAIIGGGPAGLMAAARAGEILAAQHKQPVIETHVTLAKMQNNFVSGSIFFGPTVGEGGAFLAHFFKGDWTIDYEGNGSIDCIKIRALGYPEDVLTGFCDVACTQEDKLCPDGTSVGRSGSNCEFSDCPEPEPELSEAKARAIAEKSCIKGGEALAAGNFNPSSMTWWFDANLNATKPGCNPACVVDEATKTAEINWRCMGAIVPEQ